jgi:adenylosuccinate synthase
MTKTSNSSSSGAPTQQSLYTFPWAGVKETIRSIYDNPPSRLGAYKNNVQIDHNANPRIRGIIGAQLGDEGKGKIVAAIADVSLGQPGIDTLDVIRWNGGSNAGHTVEVQGKKIDLHQVPSGIFHEKATAIMDRGMAVNIEDLRTEVDYVEDVVGSTKGRLLLSPLAALVTDLERAEEKFNNDIASKTQGGTGRGISPAYAHRLDRTGSLVRDLMSESWREHFSKRYALYEKTFHGHGRALAETPVPDFKKKREAKGEPAMVGNLTQFLGRLAEQRQWLRARSIVQDTVAHHQASSQNPHKGIIFEGAQAVGLDPWVGTYPDTTSSNTTFFGVNSGTGYYHKEDIYQRLAVIKHNPSSVGARRMPTHIDLPRDTNELPGDATNEQRWAAKVREIAHERGTTTGRYRDMNHLDLPFLTYNLRQGGANVLGVTHLDIQEEDIPVTVNIAYKNQQNDLVGYQPDLNYLSDVRTDEETIVALPGWDGEAVMKAKSVEELPENAKRFLLFLQARTGLPVVVVTNGPEHDSLISLPGYESLG